MPPAFPESAGEPRRNLAKQVDPHEKNAMNTEVTVGFWEGGDGEKAMIKLRSFGSVSELRFSGANLAAVACISPAEINRLLDAFNLAEQKRIDPDPKLIEALA